MTSAGIAGPNLPVESYPADAWRQVLDIDLTGAFLVLACRGSRHEGPGLWPYRPYRVDRRQGRQPERVGLFGRQGRVISLTKSLGKELAETGIRVNCVTPAAVRTEIFDQMTEQHIQYMLSKIPMGRFGLATEIAAMIAWLASENVRSRPGPPSICRVAARSLDG